jgi:hypothetical protein
MVKVHYRHNESLRRAASLAISRHVHREVSLGRGLVIVAWITADQWSVRIVLGCEEQLLQLLPPVAELGSECDFAEGSRS